MIEVPPLVLAVTLATLRERMGVLSDYTLANAKGLGDGRHAVFVGGMDESEKKIYMHGCKSVKAIMMWDLGTADYSCDGGENDFSAKKRKVG